MDATQPLRAATTKLAEDFRAVMTDAEQLLRQAGEGYSEVRERLEESIANAREGLTSLERSVAGSACRSCRATDGYVRTHPWESIAVGAGIGVLVGLLIGRR